MTAVSGRPLAAQLHAHQVGAGDTLVVFVHGVLDRGRSFNAVAHQLDSECRMLWYDRRGYGAAVDLPGPAVGVDGHVADLLVLLDGRRAVLVGHSFGGLTVLGTAAASPEQIAAIALYESMVAWAPGWDDSVMRGVLADPDPETAGLRMMLGERYAAMDDAERARRRHGATTFITEERSIRGERPPFDLRAVRAPIVYGTSMAERTAPVTDHLRREGLRVEVLPFPETAGHGAHRAAPVEFAGLVRRALALAAQ